MSINRALWLPVLLAMAFRLYFHPINIFGSTALIETGKTALFSFKKQAVFHHEASPIHKSPKPPAPEKNSDQEHIHPNSKWAHNAIDDVSSPEMHSDDTQFLKITPTPGEIPFVGIGHEYVSFACVLPAAYLTDCYGTPRGPGNRDHRGYDYAMALGIETWPIYTPLGGVVTYTGNDLLLGNLLVVESAGYQWHLGHNAEIVVSPGQVIKAGDLVAYAGNSGDSTFPHAHSEFRRCWPESGLCIPIDPLEVWLPGQTTFCDWEAGQVISYTLYSGERLTCGAGVNGFQIVP